MRHKHPARTLFKRIVCVRRAGSTLAAARGWGVLGKSLIVLKHSLGAGKPTGLAGSSSLTTEAPRSPAVPRPRHTRPRCRAGCFFFFFRIRRETLEWGRRSRGKRQRAGCGEPAGPALEAGVAGGRASRQVCVRLPWKGRRGSWAWTRPPPA